MTTYDWIAIAIVLLCLLFSAAFAGSETPAVISSPALEFLACRPPPVFLSFLGHFESR